MRVPNIASLALVLVLAGTHGAGARQAYQLGGGGGRPWAQAGQLLFTDAERVPGSLRPLEAREGENLALTLDERGGLVRSTPDTYTLPEDWFEAKDYMTDGDSATAFVHPPRINFFRGPGYFWTVPIYLDLGAPFPVEQIRLTTRPDHPGNQIRQYDLWVNDGSDETRNAFGDPIWQLLRRETDNLSRVAELPLDGGPVQHVYLNPGRWGPGSPSTGLGETWEVAELEVYGRGFVPQSSYVTEAIDLGQPSALGTVRWAASRAPAATVFIQSRSGSDDQPEVYWRRTGVGDQVTYLGSNGRPLTEAAYLALSPSVQAGVTADLENWSAWQTYELEEGDPGTRVRSPSPRRYVQLRVQFSSAGLDGGQIDSLAFEYSQPPVAQAVVGEIWPSTVVAGETVLFTYAVRTAMAAGQSGFTSLGVRTPARVESVEDVRIDGTPVTFDHQPGSEDAPGFAVTFPRVALDQSLLEVDFTARVFTYGTPFSGAVSDTEGDEVALEISAGDAVPSRIWDDLRVRTSLGADVLGSVEVSSPVLSPNGDQVNDQVTLTVEVLRLTTAALVTVEIFDLAGKRVRTAHRAAVSSGLVAVNWDGRSEGGQPVPPGSYLYRVAVDADGGEVTRTGHVAVVY